MIYKNSEVTGKIDFIEKNNDPAIDVTIYQLNVLLQSDEDCHLTATQYTCTHIH